MSRPPWQRSPAVNQSSRRATGRANDVARFYDLLDRLEARVGSTRVLAECNGKMNWPQRGVYFFYEGGEIRSRSGAGRRVVRVGTHALKLRARTTIWGRLSQHRGIARTGGGNHRGSVFRLLVGKALAHRGDLPLPQSWGVAGDLGAAALRCGADHTAVKQDETALEALVSTYVGAMPFLWLNVGDAPGPDSQRAVIERHAIALVSGGDDGGPPLDPPSEAWLGRYSNRAPVRRSGLWNNHYVGERYDPSFLDVLAERVDATEPL